MTTTGIQTEASVLELQKEIETLEEKIADNDRELLRGAIANVDTAELLRNLLDRIYALAIDPEQKRGMTDICLRLLEKAALTKRLGIELTESDVLILSKLEKKHPNLNIREMKICLLVKLNYDTREIARTVGISTRGMESLRYRMHQKLGLGRHESIKSYLTELAVA
jgi:DNA-binding CsgD family transcriptional regulator